MPITTLIISRQITSIPVPVTLCRKDAANAATLKLCETGILVDIDMLLASATHVLGDRDLAKRGPCDAHLPPIYRSFQEDEPWESLHEQDVSSGIVAKDFGYC